MKQRLLLLATLVLALNAQAQQKDDSTYRRFFIGSTFFVFYNLIPDDNPPGFVQLNLGYRLTPKDVVSVELNTWKYAWPLGIPWGDDYQAPEEKYPGHIRDYGIGFVYQRFWWRGAYTAVHAMNALQKYVDEDGKKIQTGYQLFMTYRAGYHIPLFKNRFFIEPSIAMTHWPIKTNTPESFAERERKWKKTFFPEPGLHFGVKF